MSTYHHGDLRAAILRTAGKVLENEGGEGLSLRHVARLAKVSHNAPYRHFADRQSLLAALAGEGFEMLAREQARAGSPLAMGEAYVRFAVDHPRRFQLMFAGGEGQGLEHLEKALAESAPDASIAAWALVHGLAHLILSGRISEAARRGRGDGEFARDVLRAVRFVARAPQSA